MNEEIFAEDPYYDSEVEDLPDFDFDSTYPSPIEDEIEAVLISEDVSETVTETVTKIF